MVLREEVGDLLPQDRKRSSRHKVFHVQATAAAKEWLRRAGRIFASTGIDLKTFVTPPHTVGDVVRSLDNESGNGAANGVRAGPLMTGCSIPAKKP